MRGMVGETASRVLRNRLPELFGRTLAKPSERARRIWLATQATRLPGIGLSKQRNQRGGRGCSRASVGRMYRSRFIDRLLSDREDVSLFTRYADS